MKKITLTMFFVVTFFVFTAISASAVVTDTVKVGLRYGSSAMFSANLENAVGEGYSFGYFDENRAFEEIGWTEEQAISMTAAGGIYINEDGTYSPDPSSGNDRFMGDWRVQVDGFHSYEAAEEYSWDYGGWPAWVDFEYVVRFGCFDSEREAWEFAEELGSGYAVKTSSTGVIVTVTRSTEILFEFDTSGVLDLGVQPNGWGDETATWFKGYQYSGGFEYPRTTGGYLSVINVVDLEAYVKGVIPYEMVGDWPIAALEAQAVCARTYACSHSKHLKSYGFDVCNTTDCQVYYGLGNRSIAPTKDSNRAVDNTEGERLYYDGYLVQDAVYHSSNGGATEDAKTVWGTAKGYLIGKEDPYEKETSIPNYEWSVTYTAEELTWILEQKGYDVGRVKDVYISQYTPMGNVEKITIEGTNGTQTVSGDTCRTIFYSSTYGKSVKSLRFDINGSKSAGSTLYVNDTDHKFDDLNGISVIAASGALRTLDGSSFTILSASGTSTVQAVGSTVKPSSSGSGKKGTFSITGTGNGHNVGLSQYGAKAMAELGYDYVDILEFYYTDITIQ